MNDHLHLIADCLDEDWVGAWAAEGVSEVEELLGKHAAFESFLDGEQHAIAD